MKPPSALSPLLAHAKTIVQSIAEGTASDQANKDAVQQLKSVVFAITSAGRHNRNLTAEEQTAVWELVCFLWVPLQNHSSELPYCHFSHCLHSIHVKPDEAAAFHIYI